VWYDAVQEGSLQLAPLIIIGVKIGEVWYPGVIAAPHMCPCLGDAGLDLSGRYLGPSLGQIVGGLLAQGSRH